MTSTAEWHFRRVESAGGNFPLHPLAYIFVKMYRAERGAPGNFFVKKFPHLQKTSYTEGNVSSKKQSATAVPERKVRIYDMKVAQGIDDVLARHNPRYGNVNTIIVEAVKFGLPKILEDIEPQSMLSDKLKSEADRIISHSNRVYDKLEKMLNKILISAVFSQEMITCVLNQIEQILAINGIKMTEEMRLNFINNLPAPLNDHYAEYLNKVSMED